MCDTISIKHNMVCNSAIVDIETPYDICVVCYTARGDKKLSR